MYNVLIVAWKTCYVKETTIYNAILSDLQTSLYKLVLGLNKDWFVSELGRLK